MIDETQHPNRGLNITSADNVRDLGGYSTHDGRTTKWGRFVRSGDMDKLTPSDQQKMIDYGINTVIDLRMAKEIAVMPNVFSQSPSVHFYNHDFWGERFDNYRSTSKGAPGEVKLADLYCSGLEKSGFVMAQIMMTIADSKTNGCAFHCRSGKDRTGLVAALLLAIAGVPEQVICADYALTSSYLAEPQATDPNQPGVYLRGCSAQTMVQTLNFLTKTYSGVGAYLNQLGVSDLQLSQIRSKLLD